MRPTYRPLFFYNCKCSPKNLFFDFPFCNIRISRKEAILLCETYTSISMTRQGSIVERPENALEGKRYCGSLYNPESPFRWTTTTTTTERKNLGNRGSRFLQHAPTSSFYSFHELALSLSLSPQSIRLGFLSSRGSQGAQTDSGVYVNLLEITSSKRRRTVIPLPREESATALKREQSLCGKERERERKSSHLVTILQQRYSLLY